MTTVRFRYVALGEFIMKFNSLQEAAVRYAKTNIFTGNADMDAFEYIDKLIDNYIVRGRFLQTYTDTYAQFVDAVVKPRWKNWYQPLTHQFKDEPLADVVLKRVQEHVRLGKIKTDILAEI